MCDLVDKPADKRPIIIPLPDGHWWPLRVQERAQAYAKERGARGRGWRELHKAVVALGVDTSEDTVRRCALGEKVTWDVADAISEALGINRPAVISTSEQHAQALASAPVVDEIRNLLGQLRTIEERAGAPDQTALIEPEHEIRTHAERPDRHGARQRR